MRPGGGRIPGGDMRGAGVDAGVPCNTGCGGGTAGNGTGIIGDGMEIIGDGAIEMGVGNATGVAAAGGRKPWGMGGKGRCSIIFCSSMGSVSDSKLPPLCSGVCLAALFIMNAPGTSNAGPAPCSGAL